MAQLDVGTQLAFQRTRAAYDRTLMAWIRTATSLISFGFAIFKFFQLDLPRTGRTDHLIGARGFAIIMVALGLISLVMGTLEYQHNMRFLRDQDPDLPRSRTIVLAVLMSALGILALVMVIMRQ